MPREAKPTVIVQTLKSGKDVHIARFRWPEANSSGYLVGRFDSDEEAWDWIKKNEKAQAAGDEPIPTPRRPMGGQRIGKRLGPKTKEALVKHTAKTKTRETDLKIAHAILLRMIDRHGVRSPQQNHEMVDAAVSMTHRLVAGVVGKKEA